MGQRRLSLVSVEREESLRKLAATIGHLAEEAFSTSPTMQSAVAVGRGMARSVNAYRGRAAGIVRRRTARWRGEEAGNAIYDEGRVVKAMTVEAY